MKYIVELKYTNPSHEHVSLRRRVDTISRMVEARDEGEAIRRAANQQQALGFMIKEAKVVKPASLNEEVELDESMATAQKVADRAAVVAKTNPDSKKRMTASDLAQKAQARTRNTTGVATGITNRGAGNKATRKLGGVPPYQMDLHKKQSSVSEEAEQIDETKRMSAAVKLGRAFDRARAESDASRRRGAELMQQIRDKKAKEGEAATRRAMEKELEHNPHYRTEEVEQIEEDRPMSAPAYSSVSAKILTGKTGTNFGYAPNKMPPHLKDAQAKSDVLSRVAKRPQAGTLAAKNMKEEVEYIEEKLTASDPASKWIHDFVHSDNPKFSGKSKEERIKMALGAKYAANRAVKEEAELEEARKMSRVEWRTGTEGDVEGNNKRIYDRLAKEDPERAAAFLDNVQKLKGKDKAKQPPAPVDPGATKVVNKKVKTEKAADKLVKAATKQQDQINLQMPNAKKTKPTAVLHPPMAIKSTTQRKLT